MTNFRVTVLIAHRNYQEYLPSAIQSVKNQTYPCHICVIDDFSTNRKSVENIANSVLFSNAPNCYIKDNLVINSDNNNTIIYITDKNHKQAYARNRGIECLWNKTDIFVVLDADDEMYPNKVEECLKVFEQAPSEIGAVYADHDTLNVTTGSIKREYREPFSLLRLQRECIVHSGSAISKTALEVTKEDTGFFDETLAPVEDFDLWLRVAEKFMVVHIPKSLSFVRVHPQNCTYTISQQYWTNQHQNLYQKLLKRNVKNK